jgi:hypothetical protein
MHTVSCQYSASAVKKSPSMGNKIVSLGAFKRKLLQKMEYG